MMYPVSFEVSPPARYDRAQVPLRILLMVLLAAFGCTFGWLFFVLYLGLPAFAVVMIGRQGGPRYLDEVAPRVVDFLRWVIALYAYLGLLTDRLPTSGRELGVTLTVAPTGQPTKGSALARLITSLPGAAVLAILGFVSGLVWIVAAICILANESVPAALYDFQRGVVGWQARLFVYHASLVDRVPPLSLETGPAPADHTT